MSTHDVETLPGIRPSSCRFCGYSLWGTSRHSECPECGAPVELSRSSALIDMHLASTRLRLGRGFVVMALSGCLSMVFLIGIAACGIVFPDAPWVFHRLHILFLLTLPAAELCWLAGTALVLFCPHQNRRYLPFYCAQARGPAVGAAAVSAVIAIWAVVWYPQLIRSDDDLAFAALVVFVVIFMSRVVSLIAYPAWLIRLYEDWHGVSREWRLVANVVTAITLTAGLLMSIWIFVVEAFSGFSGSLDLLATAQYAITSGLLVLFTVSAVGMLVFAALAYQTSIGRYYYD